MKAGHGGTPLEECVKEKSIPLDLCMKWNENNFKMILFVGKNQ